MRRLMSAVALTVLAACGDGNPFDNPVTDGDTPGGDTTTNSIPEDLSKNLQAATFNSATGTLTLNLTGLDAGPLNATYVRKPLLDIGTLQAYAYQQTPSDRHYTAVVDEAVVPGGSVQAVVVSDGGQFGVYYSGGGYSKTGAFDKPVSGTSKYLGDYAGLTNLDTPAASPRYDVATPPAALPADAYPAQSAAVSGTIFLTANFTDNLVNGTVANRILVRDGSALPTIDLSSGVIAADGTFLGGAGYDGQSPGAIGSFGGTFGGTDSTAIAGVVTLNQFFDDGGIAGGQEREQGVFVLIECGQPGGAPSC